MNGGLTAIPALPVAVIATAASSSSSPTPSPQVRLVHLVLNAPQVSNPATPDPAPSSGEAALLSHSSLDWTQVGFSQKFLHPGGKFHTSVASFIPGWQVSYPGGKFHIWVESFIPRWKVSYPGGKFQTQVESFIPGWKVSYPCRKFLTGA
jgi:hypothetical protein